MKITSSIFSRQGLVLLWGSKLSWTFVNMETFKTNIDFLWVIDQRPFFLFIFCFNVFLAFTATLGNTLILIALHKVSSIHPPTKILLRCLAMTDFCVGVILQPLFVAFLMEIASDNRRILFLTLSTFNFTFCGFSFATATAISVDRLLALFLGLRYRHTVTFKTSSLPCCLLLSSFNCKWFYILLIFSGLCEQRRICCYHNILVPFGLLSRQNISQTATASSSSTTWCWTWTSKRQRNSTEHWTIQKDCLHHSLDAVSIGVLLFPNVHFDDTSKCGHNWLVQNRINFSRICINSRLL